MKSRLLNSAAIFILLFVQISNRIQAQSSSATNPALEPCRPTAMAATTEASTANATENAAPATQEAANGAPILNVVTTVAPLTNLAYNIGGGTG